VRRLVAIVCFGLFLVTGCSSGLPCAPDSQEGSCRLKFNVVASGLSPKPGVSSSELTGRIVNRDQHSTRLSVSTTQHVRVSMLTLVQGELWVTLESTATDGTAHESLRLSLVDIQGQLPDNTPVRFRDIEGEELLSKIGRDDALDKARAEIAPGLRPSQSGFNLRAEPGGTVEPVWVFFFDEGEFLNAACDAIISGGVAVGARHGRVYEPELIREIAYPPSLRVAGVGQLSAVTAQGLPVTRKGENGPFYVVHSDGETEELHQQTGDWTAIDALEPRTGEWDITLPEPDGGGEWVWVREQLCPVAGDYSTSLFFVTEVIGPHYGDFWSHYSLWEYDLQEQGLNRHVTLPTGLFYVFPSCEAVVVNYLDGVLIVPLQGASE